MKVDELISELSKCMSYSQTRVFDVYSGSDITGQLVGLCRLHAEVPLAVVSSYTNKRFLLLSKGHWRTRT